MNWIIFKYPKRLKYLIMAAFVFVIGTYFIMVKKFINKMKLGKKANNRMAIYV